MLDVKNHRSLKYILQLKSTTEIENPMRKIIIMLISLLTSAVSAEMSTECRAVTLNCEHLINPIGIDNPAPRFSWQIADKRQHAYQQAYQLVVGKDSSAVAQGKGDMWETPKIAAADNLVTYGGKALQPFTKYYWAVRVWDLNGKACPLSETASFETGMMSKWNWKGCWISDTDDINLKPAPLFRKTFKTAGKVKSASVYIAAAGLYELFINGKRVGDHYLDPMYTRFDRRNLYVTYDITALINNNDKENAVGVLLGNGWYNHQSTAVWKFDKAPWRARPKFCLDLYITYENGTSEIISTDGSWKTSLSSIIFNSIYTAEHHDARLYQKGWNESGFDDSEWKNAEITAAPSLNITAQTLYPICRVETIKPRSMRKLDEQTYIYDLGRNIAGVSQITVAGKRGTTLRLKHGEKLDENGRVDISNIDVHYRPTDDSDPFQTDIYILSGQGKETFYPHFNYKGFRYIEITADSSIDLQKNSLTAYFMHSDVPPRGRIESSSELINKIWRATNSSYLSNLYGYPTDCPQREKNGWTGDAHISIETGLYNFDGLTIYEKWLADHRDEQQPNGILPAIIPTGGWGYHWANGPDWTSTIAIIPWNIYLFYGDAKILADNYLNIKRYVDHISEISPDGLTDWGLGDWIPVKSKTPKEFTSSIYYYVDTRILAEAAKILHKNDDYEKYTALSQKISAAINTKYYNEESGLYGHGYQTELSAALYWGIVPEANKALVSANLAKRVHADNDHIDVGLLGSKTILNALSENGYADLAFTLASQKTFPSWGWMIENGATTLYENWIVNADKDISLNHIMFGEISAWFYKALGGIKPDPNNPGFKQFFLQPNFVKGLSSFKAEFNSPYGKILSDWKRSGKKIQYHVTVPANSTAALRLKAQKIIMNGKKIDINSASGQKELVKLDLPAGQYKFEIVEY